MPAHVIPNPRKMPDGRTYIIDAFVKDGILQNKWVEIKGWMSSTGQERWNWFYSQHQKSALLLNATELKRLGIL